MKQRKATSQFLTLKTYQIDVNGSVNFTKSLVTRGARDGKAGIINLADLGSFFVSERVPLLVEYEQVSKERWLFLQKAYVHTIKTTLQLYLKSSKKKLLQH